MDNNQTSLTVLITGASTGIGEQCAYKFSKKGYNLILLARSIQKLESIKEAIEKDTKVKVLLGQVDVQSNASLTHFFEEIKAPFTNIGILVNNAGLALGLEPIHEVSPNNIDKMIDTNVKGCIYLMQKCIPIMKKLDKAHIINISSIAGLQSYQNGSIYCGSKHALIGITNSVRLELIDTNIKVTSINPGLVETEFSSVRFSGDKEKARKVYEGIKPLRGEDIADIVVYVAMAPDHVVITDLNVMPVGQGNVYSVSRNH